MSFSGTHPRRYIPKSTRKPPRPLRDERGPVYMPRPRRRRRALNKKRTYTRRTIKFTVRSSRAPLAACTELIAIFLVYAVCSKSTGISLLTITKKKKPKIIIISRNLLRNTLPRGRYAMVPAILPVFRKSFGTVPKS